MITCVIIGILLNAISTIHFYHYTMNWKLETVFDLVMAIGIILFCFIPFSIFLTFLGSYLMSKILDFLMKDL